MGDAVVSFVISPAGTMSGVNAEIYRMDQQEGS
jgi:hypothetical protein